MDLRRAAGRNHHIEPEDVFEAADRRAEKEVQARERTIAKRMETFDADIDRQIDRAGREVPGVASLCVRRTTRNASARVLVAPRIQFHPFELLVKLAIVLGGLAKLPLC